MFAKKLVNKKFNFFITNNDQPWKGKIANIVALIGENGVGKTTLLRWLKKIFCKLKCVFECSFNSCNSNLNERIINRYSIDRNYLYINFCTKEKLYSVRYNLFLPESSNEILQLGLRGYKWKEINQPGIDLNFNSHTKIASWDEDFLDYDGTKFLFFGDSVNYPHMLDIVKEEIKRKYFNEYLELEKKLQDVNKVSEESKRQNINSLETNFKLLVDELYRITKIRISIKENNEKIKKIIISENDDTNYDFSSLSSSQKKLLVIWFKIIEIMLFQKNKCNGLLLFVDEIDNSLSPKWQEKFMDLLISLSKELNDKKITHQFFISTHSPSILKNLLNSNNVAIINVKEGINIKNSDDKKILLNNKKISYDEIVYLYYDIVTPSYYLSLFEKLKSKISQIENKDVNCKYVDDWLNQKAKIEKNIWYEKNDDGKSNYQTKLVRFRHLLVHGEENEEGYKNYSNNKEEINEKITNDFYNRYGDKNNFEQLLKEQIEIIRKILINWKK